MKLGIDQNTKNEESDIGEDELDLLEESDDGQDDEPSGKSKLPLIIGAIAVVAIGFSCSGACA
ncbi:MAG: hypothetical protein ACLR6B_03610 [Blautia sp.]